MMFLMSAVKLRYDLSDVEVQRRRPAGAQRGPLCLCRARIPPFRHRKFDDGAAGIGNSASGISNIEIGIDLNFIFFLDPIEISGNCTWCPCTFLLLALTGLALANGSACTASQPNTGLRVPPPPRHRQRDVIAQGLGAAGAPYRFLSPDPRLRLRSVSHRLPF
ncbi:Hypothetical protein NTJ_00449 [Nesidiocoris tenuis]|uniref:Uncharacterized protein n=1 Tax=Nesidiocoris tenuis TaxID=355587 RepID=A0ABN7A922_9HEMI|nr:Hypothetical protein NTJ_00449 [Nesidiocoris tenuis]